MGARADRPGSERVYCSKRCGAQRIGPRDRRVEGAILDLLRARARDASICPSEAARAVGGYDWRDELERVRRAGRRLADRGDLEVTQRGHVVDAATARGPIRYRLPRR